MHKGRLKKWNENRGFGFISTENKQGDIFIHISALKGMSRRPVVGDVISYHRQTDHDGKSRAVNARIEGLSMVNPKTQRKGVADSPIKNKKSFRKNITNLIFIVVLGLAFLGYLEKTPELISSNTESSVTDENSLLSAFNNRQSNLQIGGAGKVVKILSDDLKGSRHQKFIVKLSSGQKLLIAHNIDLAPRINTLRKGDSIQFYGEYEWNSKGGIIHWTHHDPSGRHEDGWLRHNGKTYK